VHPLQRSTPPPPTPDALSREESSFLSGVLAHLPALAALTLPLRASYDRVVDGVGSGGTNVCWGTDNREATVRLCQATSPSSRNIEVKCVDGTANPYIVLAGILGVGSRAISEGRSLKMDDCGKDGKVAAHMTQEEKKAMGIVDKLPANLMEARKLFKVDAVLREVLGQQFVEGYLSVNKVSRFPRGGDSI
jgi:glutamine synthetase